MRAPVLSSDGVDASAWHIFVANNSDLIDSLNQHDTPDGHLSGALATPKTIGGGRSPVLLTQKNRERLLSLT